METYYDPSTGWFRFGNGTREKVLERLVFLIPQGYCQKPLKTHVDVIERGKTPILWSIIQMMNLCFDISCRPDNVNLSCECFGWYREPLTISDTMPVCLDLQDMLWQGAKLDKRSLPVVDRQSVV